MNKLIDYIRSSIGFQTIALWLLVFILAFPHNIWISIGLSFRIALLTLVSIMTTYYLTQKVLIPKIAMKKKRKVLFVISSLLMLGLLINISARLETYIYYQYVKEPITYKEPMGYYEFKGIFSMTKYIALKDAETSLNNLNKIKGTCTPHILSRV